MQRKRRNRQNKIDKRILRCELAYITPDDYQPDLETQERLFPGIRVICIHLFVAMDVDEGIPLKIPRNKADAIKSVSAYRVLLTESTFHQIGRLPEALKQTIWDYIDNDVEDERLEETGFRFAIRLCPTRRKGNGYIYATKYVTSQNNLARDQGRVWKAV